jgi:alkylated DNA repair dioxygenase AlkB
MAIHLYLDGGQPSTSNSVERTVIQQIKVKAAGISGLSHYSNYITSDQEVELAIAIDGQPWNTNWKRRRQPYGQSYDDSAELRPAIPHWAEFLIERLVSEGISKTPFDQMLVNEYLPGQGIALHRDYEPFDRTVVSLSLLSACVMDFRHVKSGRRESVLLEPRSLLVLSDEARYEWEHGIAARKNDRWEGVTIPRARRLSVTFRLLKQVAPTR